MIRPIVMPVAWWAGNKWLQVFSFRIPVHGYAFGVAGLMTVFIALFTLGVILSKPL